jgi:hypothetical protein
VLEARALERRGELAGRELPGAEGLQDAPLAGSEGVDAGVHGPAATHLSRTGRRTRDETTPVTGARSPLVVL